MKSVSPSDTWQWGSAMRPAAPHLDCFEHKSSAATVLARLERGKPILIDRRRDAVADGGARRKIWDLDGSLHCSVIGTCLSSGELRALIGKFQPPASEKPTEHTLHMIAVSAAGQHNLLAKHIQKALDRRHTAALRHFGEAKSAEELRRLWSEARQAGEIPGAYWAVLTHAKATEAVVREVFGDVHMLSHLVGAANRADIRKLHQLEEEKASLEDKLARQQTRLRDGIVARDTKLRELNAALSAAIEQRISHAGPTTANPLSEAAVLHGVVADLRKLLNREVQRREKAEQRAEALAHAHQKADRARLALDEELAALRGELEAAEAQLGADDGEASATSLALTGATLLYVGGRPHQVARLRKLVEAASGQLVHHDGGIEERADLLPGLVSRADAAFFPVDCISHRAALLLKRLCRQAGKPYIPLRSSGAGAMLRALRAAPLGQTVTPRSAAE